MKNGKSVGQSGKLSSTSGGSLATLRSNGSSQRGFGCTKDGKKCIYIPQSYMYWMDFFSSNCTTMFIGAQMQNPCAHKTHEPYSLATSANLQRTAPRNSSGSVRWLKYTVIVTTNRNSKDWSTKSWRMTRSLHHCLQRRSKLVSSLFTYVFMPKVGRTSPMWWKPKYRTYFLKNEVKADQDDKENVDGNDSEIKEDNDDDNDNDDDEKILLQHQQK